MKLALVALAVLLSTVMALAIPQLINYQGSLSRLDGSPLDTVVAVTFRIYDDPDAGSVSWTETQAAVVVTDGWFQVLVGSVTPLPDVFSVDRWLGITVGGDSEMSPRVQMVSVAHAYRVGTVDGASGGTITGDVNILGKANIGSGNTNTGIGSFVVGTNNHARGDYSTVAGGGGASPADSNSAGGTYSTVGGGVSNTASYDVSTVSGGFNNIASGASATVSGGFINAASGTDATVSGGVGNTASGDYATVSGGADNAASGLLATIAGGLNNYAVAHHATVSGGSTNAAAGIGATISGGENNYVSDYAGTIPGGRENTVNGRYGFAAGRHAQAFHAGSFVWADSTTTVFTSAAINTFNVRASGGTRIYTNGAATLGAQLIPNATAWSALCDSSRKERYGKVNTHEVLSKLQDVPIETWSYKEDPKHIHHMGPMAQDLWNAFHLGESDTTISTLDPDGVALAAIQELSKENAELRKELSELRSQFQTQIAGQQKTLKEEK